MTYTSISERFTKLAARAIKSSRFIALAIIAAVTLGAMQPAQAQSSDTWKSIAIIGGSTAAGAYIGHKVGGSTGTWVGAAAGASAGYGPYDNGGYPYPSGFQSNNRHSSRYYSRR